SATRSRILDDRCFDRGSIFRILGPVFVAGQIEPGLVAKRVDRLRELEVRRDQTLHSLRTADDLAAIVTAEPHPQRDRRGWHIDTGVREGRKDAQPIDRRAERGYDGSTEPDELRP